MTNHFFVYTKKFLDLDILGSVAVSCLKLLQYSLALFIFLLLTIISNSYLKFFFLTSLCLTHLAFLDPISYYQILIPLAPYIHIQTFTASKWGHQMCSTHLETLSRGTILSVRVVWVAYVHVWSLSVVLFGWYVQHIIIKGTTLFWLKKKLLL